MSDLTDRQSQLLKAIIEIYVKTGEPVASDTIEKNVNLGVSPATIRNEMMKLTESGFLKQPHISAGRIPTAMGFRLYINDLMKEKQVPIVDEISIRQNLLDHRLKYNRMVQEATKALSKKCGLMSMAMIDDELYYTGAAHILDLPEFFDIDVARFVLSLFEESALLQKVINLAQGTEPLHIIFGEETGFEYLETTSFAFINFENVVGQKGIIGVVGPARLNFPVVLPYLKYIGEVLTEVGRA